MRIRGFDPDSYKIDSIINQWTHLRLSYVSEDGLDGVYDSWTISSGRAGSSGVIFPHGVKINLNNQPEFGGVGALIIIM